VEGIGALTTDDLLAASEIGGVIKPLVSAVRGPSGIEAFVGPALLSNREPLATLGGALNGIRLDGKHVSNLFFSGPGAGPEVTAATLLDDGIEAALTPNPRWGGSAAGKGRFRETRVSAPTTSWFVRVTFRGVVPSDDSVRALVGAVGLEVEQVVRGSNGASRWLTLGSHSRLEVEAARERLRSTHRIESLAIRRVS
jgi:homoserine dehydrogenase